ncbi:hypothetical protein AAFF_G00408050 [Aldrovandia affinis]|uniref:Ig-like domain-containing protein n=1 Tax=Aldrovandia affinis TaxID=143900 RepID=A0AAD7SC00_9TELE|nr:hypothetical protein AAFF_G00408050 [Aldrovandia affinis]
MAVFTPAALFLWFFAVVTTATNRLMELRASGLVAEQCHGNVTLLCDISHDKTLKVNHFSWIRMADGETLCTFNDDAEAKKHNRILCKYTDQEQLALTLRHLLPADEGNYTCKLRSNLGIRHTMSAVKVRECFQGSEPVPSSSGVACRFYGVYPQGEVHWFDRDKNVTDKSTADNSGKPDRHGMYNVSSRLLTEDRSREEYNCSLWIPSTGAYLTSTLVRMPVKGGATSVHIVGLVWVLFRTWILIA